LEQLGQVDRWIGQAIVVAQAAADRGAELRHTRNRALLLLGFWRGFRGDEITRLQVESVQVVPGEGMSCFLPRTKGDRQMKGITVKAPALSQFCPVTAYTAWIELAQLEAGPVFRSVDRWGHVGKDSLHSDSLIPLLRAVFKEAGISDPAGYSGHSLRRGFANWATGNGWDLKTLMEYVGWKSMQSALRYVDSADPFAQQRIELMLPSSTNAGL
jgi:site-specific recombinase XerD